MASKRTAAKRLKLGDSCRFRVGVLGGFLAYPYVASWHLSTKLRGLPGQSEWRLSGEDETEWADLLFGGYRREADIDILLNSTKNGIFLRKQITSQREIYVRS